MKIWISIVILMLIIMILVTIGLLTRSFMNTNVDELNAQIAETQNLIYAGDMEEAIRCFESFQITWHDSKPRWELLVHYHEIDIIDGSISKTDVLLQNDDIAAIAEELASIRESLTHLKEREHLAIQRIL